MFLTRRMPQKLTTKTAYRVLYAVFLFAKPTNLLELPKERKMAINGKRDISISAAYLKENRKIKKCRGYRQPENLPIKGRKPSFVCFRQRNTKFAA